MGIFLERCMLTCINMFLPPLSVMLVAGLGMDCLINTLWFLCGVIPGHIHGFYVTWSYFSRKRKVRKGRYPGGPKAFIYSKRVINGDASDERVRELWEAEKQRAEGDRPVRRRGSGRRMSTRTRSPPGLAGGGGGGGGGGAGSRMSAQSSGVGGRSRASTPPVDRRASRRASRRQGPGVDGYDRSW